MRSPASARLLIVENKSNINSGTSNKAGTNRLFPLSQVVATPDALDALDRAAVNAMDLIQRHQSGDWGNVPPGDAEENDRSVVNGWRILSSYTLCTDQKLWIITESERSTTVVIHQFDC